MISMKTSAWAFAVVPCFPHAEQPSDNAVLRVKPTQPLEVSPDGMSGGAAFAIQYAAPISAQAYYARLVKKLCFMNDFVRAYHLCVYK
jgi:hypothetical protein